MKNLIFKSGIIIIICILFSACKSSIMKRHYMKGYFVENKNHRLNTNTTAKDKSVPLQKYAYAEEQIKSEKNIGEKVSIKNGESAENIAKAAGKKIGGKSSSENKKSKNDYAAIAKNENNISAGSAKNIEANSPAEVKRHSLRGFADKLKDPEAGVVGTALSLFWIVIIIVIAAYIIGLFALADMASGGFIHILGVIALVLLILWLLRIV